MTPASFEHVRASSVDDAVSAPAECGGEASEVGILPRVNRPIPSPRRARLAHCGLAAAEL